MSGSLTRPYRMTARAEAVEATAEGILDATAEAFWERPTDTISLAEIARRAGTTKQTVLRHFDGKERLFAAAVERQFERARAERAEVRSGDVAGAVRVLVAHYERLGDGVVRLLAEEARSPALREIVERGRGVHAAWCGRTFAPALAGLAGADRSRRLAQLVAICDVYVWKVLRRDRGLGPRQTETAMLELLAPLVGRVEP
ncbi:MAG TPA: helix-turn-helix domain-containing protein [Solirubrobacterales bacterium]|nr:helix-turn-helix domain-containing protein [Solirubrobacterales bacterium]